MPPSSSAAEPSDSGDPGSAPAPSPAPDSAAPAKNAKRIAKLSSDEILADSRGVFRRLFGYVRPYKGRLAWGIVFGVLSGLFNGILLLVLKSVFTVVLPDPESGGTPKVFRPFEDLPFDKLAGFEIHRPDISVVPEWMFVTLVCLSIPVLLSVRGLFDYLHKYCMLWLNSKVLHRLRDEVFGGLMRQSLSFFNTVKQGELIQTVANQTRLSADSGSQLLSAAIKHPISIVAIFTTLLWMDWRYTLGAIIVFPLCIVPVALISRKVRKAGGREEQEAEGLMVTLHESFAGIRLVKAHAREDYQRDKFDAASRQVIKFILRWRKAMEISSPLVEIVGSLGITLGMIYAWWEGIRPETFLVLNMGLMSIYPHAKALSRIQVQLQKCLVATSKVFAYIDAEPEVADKPGAAEICDCRGSIELEGVSFSYEPGKKALDGVDLRFEPGKKYALVGQSGSGKSTIFSLLMRFYDPDQGAVKVDGRDIRDCTQASLRDQIGLVSQDTFLFHDTIRENIRYGRLDASDGEIECAARQARAHEFITEQSEGYDTVLGDKGCTLSGGQQQRLSIARAVLRDAPILFLDEATSALDSDSEKQIQEELVELSRGKTVLAIAHRLSTVLDSDEIVVMREGQVLDKGPHADLLERCGEYQRLYRLQFEEGNR